MKDIFLSRNPNFPRKARWFIYFDDTFNSYLSFYSGEKAIAMRKNMPGTMLDFEWVKR